MTTHTPDIIAVTEALYRFAAAIDLRDAELLTSAFAEGAVWDFRPAGEKAGSGYRRVTYWRHTRCSVG